MDTQEDPINITDEELVNLTLKDKEHYRHLMKRYEEKLMRYIMRIAQVKKEDAEDILQGVFIKTYIKLNDFDPKLKFSSWIYRITHNETIDHLRRQKTRPQTYNLEVNEIAVQKLRADLDIEKDIDKDFLKQSILKLLEGVDKKYQDVIILKYIEDKDYQEISDILKKPMGTVAVLLNRAKAQLKKEIAKGKINL